MNSSSTKKTMLSGIQATGDVPHLGNYLGAIKNWVSLQQEYEYFLFIADMHSLTVHDEKRVLKDNVLKLSAYLLASGIDPEQSTLFVQSQVPQHTQLNWILDCVCYMGELSRMTQYKDKSKKAEDNLNVGLFAYPILQAADILLYKPHFVPVGEDQRQHIELTRDLSERFNKRYKKNIFRIPEPFIKKEGGRIMDFQDPSSKMSKSSVTTNGVIFLNDTDSAIMKKVKSAVTDSGQSISAENISPGLKNLLEVLALLTDKKPELVLQENVGKLYGHFKVEVAEVILETLKPIRERALYLLNDVTELERLLAKGAEKARAVAEKTLLETYKAVGLK